MNINKDIIYESGDYKFKNFIHLTSEEIKQVWDWRNDESIRKYMYTCDIIPFENHVKFISTLNERIDVAYWLVFRKDKAVGVTSLTDIDIPNSKCELGFYMSPEMGKTGIGLDFLFNALLHVFDNIKVRDLYGGVHYQNINAITLDKYLGLCVVENSDEKFLPWALTSEYFHSNSMEKNNIVKYVKFIKGLK